MLRTRHQNCSGNPFDTIFLGILLIATFRGFNQVMLLMVKITYMTVTDSLLGKSKQLKGQSAAYVHFFNSLQISQIKHKSGNTYRINHQQSLKLPVDLELMDPDIKTILEIS